MDINFDKVFALYMKEIAALKTSEQNIYIYDVGVSKYVVTINFDLDEHIVIRYAGINKTEYIEMGKKYGGFISDFGIIFDNMENVKKFAEWLESMKILKTLRSE